VVEGGQVRERLTAWPIWKLCQIAAARARTRRAMHRDALDGACTVLFQVELAFEGVVYRLDELANLYSIGAPGRSTSFFRGGQSCVTPVRTVTDRMA
jgi:hypothetical protein